MRAATPHIMNRAKSHFSDSALSDSGRRALLVRLLRVVKRLVGARGSYSAGVRPCTSSKVVCDQQTCSGQVAGTISCRPSAVLQYLRLSSSKRRYGPVTRLSL